MQGSCGVQAAVTTQCNGKAATATREATPCGWPPQPSLPEATATPHGFPLLPRCKTLPREVALVHPVGLASAWPVPTTQFHVSIYQFTKILKQTPAL